MAVAAVEELKDTLARSFPDILAKNYYDAAANHNKGGYLPRLQAAPGSHKTSSADPHVNGLALDIMLFAFNLTERSLALQLVDVFVAHKKIMGWSAVIYNGITTDDYGGPKPHTGVDPHTTHIHIEWPRSRGEASRGFSATIEPDLALADINWRFMKWATSTRLF